MSIEKPQQNWTKFPNHLLDNIDTMSPHAFKILGVIIRKTIGFTDPNCMFSIDYLRLKTGIGGKTQVVNSLKELVELGVIEQSGRVNRVNQYRVKWGKVPKQESSTELSPKMGILKVPKSDPLKENISTREHDIVKEPPNDILQLEKFWNKQTHGKAAPLSLNKSTIRGLNAFINKYSVDILKACITNMSKDGWSNEAPGRISINRLIKPDKRDNNVLKFNGKIKEVEKAPPSEYSESEYFNKG